MKAGITITQDAISKYHDSLVKKSKLDAGLVKNVTAMYVNAQVRRWESSGSSEGNTWPRVKNQKAKERRFAAYPEGGRRTLIATGNLLRAATLQPPGATPPRYPRVTGSRLVADSSITFAVKGKYVGYAAEDRPYMKFSEATKRQILDEMKRWLMYG
jgi:hypothetical protein